MKRRLLPGLLLIPALPHVPRLSRECVAGSYFQAETMSRFSPFAYKREPVGLSEDVDEVSITSVSSMLDIDVPVVDVNPL